jgi:hypothetical protein
MKKIFTILTLLVLTGNYLTAAVMYQIDSDNADKNFSTTTDYAGAFYAVGVTIVPTASGGGDDGVVPEWEISDAKLNVVFKLPQEIVDYDQLSTADSSPVDAGVPYAKTKSINGVDTYSRMKVVTEPELQYTGKPLFMHFYSNASTSDDYKGDTFQNGEVFSRFLPILDLVKFDSEGAFFETWYRKSSEMNWTKCETIESGPNGPVSNDSEVWDDLNDYYPVEITWDAKTDLPNFDDEIVIRVRAKYGTEAFLTAPASSTPGDGNSSYPGDGNSSYPGDGNSSYPGDGNSSYPGDGNSSYPGDGNSSNP